MLSFIKSAPGVSWDSNGNLLEPIRNFNIIDILQKMSSPSDKIGFEKLDVPFIKMLLHSVGLDSSFIRNSAAKRQLFGGGGGGVGGNPSKARARKVSWVGY